MVHKWPSLQRMAQLAENGAQVAQLAENGAQVAQLAENGAQVAQLAENSSVHHANLCKVHATFGKPLLTIRRRSTTDVYSRAGDFCHSAVM